MLKTPNFFCWECGDFGRVEFDIFFCDLREKINPMTNTTFTNKEAFEQYLNRLFTDAVTNYGTTSKSLSEILLEKAVSYGRAIDDAKEDVKRILNVREAVGVLLKSAASNSFFDDS